jgi:hypothetical protein
MTATVYYSDAYDRAGSQDASAAAPLLPAVETRAHRIVRALAVLDETRRAVRSALQTLDLCQAVSAWPDTALAEPVQAHAVRALAASTRNHLASGATCSCDGDATASARGIVKEWLHLWRRAVRYVEDPDANGWDLVDRAARVVHDYAAFASTGDPADILGAASSPPSAAAGAPPARTKTATLYQRGVPDPVRPAEGQPAGAADHPAYSHELPARSRWFG